MAEKIKMKISPALAVYLRPGTSPETRLAGCRAASDFAPFERVTLLFCLSKDPESLVKSAAVKQLELLPEDVFSAYAESPDAHPVVLERLCGLGTLPNLSDQSDQSDQSDEPDHSDEPDQISEEFQSKFKMAQSMGIGEKIKTALTGDKEWRSILIKDANKLISGGVIKNPRITEAEVLAMIKTGIQNDEIMRLICANREWIKKYNIRKALITNNRTPLQNAMRYLDTMGEKDLASFAKSKNISTVISTMAKRILLNKKK